STRSATPRTTRCPSSPTRPVWPPTAAWPPRPSAPVRPGSPPTCACTPSVADGRRSGMTGKRVRRRSGRLVAVSLVAGVVVARGLEAGRPLRLLPGGGAHRLADAGTGAVRRAAERRPRCPDPAALGPPAAGLPGDVPATGAADRAGP